MPRKPVHLVCPPSHYEVAYVINPWMRPEAWAEQRAEWQAKAHAQWDGLVAALKSFDWDVEEMQPVAHLPDMVFATDYAFILDNVALVAHFATAERAPEEALAAAWFSAHGYEVRRTTTRFEGGGDAVYDDWCRTIFVGGGEIDALPFRSEGRITHELEAIYGRRSVQLPLINPFFYHLDTCFCPLWDGHALYVPSALSEGAIATLKEIYGEKLVAVSEEDGARFACNAVVHGKQIVMPKVSDQLTQLLHGWGFETRQLEMEAFILAGGASRCLTLKLTD